MRQPQSFLLSNFRGIAPKVNPALLRPGAATVAIDCDFRGGTIRPRQRPAYVDSLRNGDDPAGGFVVMADGRFRGTGKPCNQAGFQNRIFVSGDGAPYYLREEDNPLNQYPLGIPAEGFSIEAVRATGADAGTSQEMVSIIYAITIENRDGDESDLFGRTEEVNVPIDGSVVITLNKDAGALMFDPTDYKVNLYAISRTGSAANRPIAANSLYRLIEQWDSNLPPANDAAAVPDAKSFTDTATTLRHEPKTLYPGSSTRPPADMKKLTVMPGGFMVGHTDEYVYFSEVGKPATYPPDFRIKPPGGGRIIGLGVDIERCYVFTDNSPPIIVDAVSPDATEVYFSEIPYICIAGGTVINSGNGIMYASRSGLVNIRGQAGGLLTKPVLDARTFAPYIAEGSGRMVRYFDDTILLYGGSRRLLLDQQEPEGMGISEISPEMEDAKEYEGELFFLHGGNLYKNEGSNEPQTAYWESGVLRSQKKQALHNLETHGNFSEIQSNQSVGGIGNTAIGELALGDARTTVNNSTFEGNAEICVYELFDSGIGNRRLSAGPLNIQDGDSIPIKSGPPVYDLQVCIRTKNEVESVLLTPDATT